ncbi:MAG: AGE family epimerase/isomerase [Pirellulales bacterium]|nr:AGE family epimerase/isomerase [Pirellulales bacterium]
MPSLPGPLPKGEGRPVQIDSSDGTFSREYAAALREQYRAALWDDMIPWWERHSPDQECGGYYSCLERDGQTYAGDKYLWLVGRQAWMFSHLYNNAEPRPEWLELARHGARFLLAHGFTESGKMHFRLSREGRPRAGCLSLYTECFAAMALAELGAASGDEGLWDRAVAMVDRIEPRLGAPSDTPMLGYPIHAEFHLHAHDMMRLTVAWVLNALQPAARWEDAISRSVASVLSKHWKPELGALLENVAPDGAAMLDMPEGRMVHPGHAIETAWMLMEVARARGDEALFQTAVEIVLASLQRGWDEQYGGLRYVLNLDGSPPHPIEADMKLWWPHGETLCALLLAWIHTGRDDLGAWYRKVHEYTFDRFPDPQYGEWFGYLNRDGSPAFTAKANGWKGCFHLPRILFRGERLLAQRVAADTAAGGHGGRFLNAHFEDGQRNHHGDTEGTEVIETRKTASGDT